VIKFIRKKYNQIQLTKALATQANLGPGEWQSLRRTIWFNPIDDNSLRLNHNGYSFLKRCDYKSYEIEISPYFLANKHLLALERLFPDVYLLVNAKKIIVFDEEIAVLLHLIDGNLMQYLDNLGSVDK
jgi:hypothetical protein